MSTRAIGYQQITSLVAATGLTVPPGAAFFIATPSSNSVRWRDDGTDPTASVGYPLAVGSELQYQCSSMSRIKFIEQAASATLDVAYYSGD